VCGKETGSLEDLQDITAVVWINRTQDQFQRPADGNVKKKLRFIEGRPGKGLHSVVCYVSY
jgi:hypothetical protein